MSSQESSSAGLADYDESSTTSSPVASVDQAQLEAVRNHLLSTNANFLAPRMVSASNLTADQTTSQPRQSIFVSIVNC